jgi:hypothetical protein
MVKVYSHMHPDCDWNGPVEGKDKDKGQVHSFEFGARNRLMYASHFCRMLLQLHSTNNFFMELPWHYLSDPRQHRVLTLKELPCGGWGVIEHYCDIC